MPTPVSDTEMVTYRPLARPSEAAAATSSKSIDPVATLISPPSGMASRALIARFKSALSSWFTSTIPEGMSVARSIVSTICSLMVLRNRTSNELNRLLRSTILASRDCRLEKASNRCVRDAARIADVHAASMKR